MDPGSILVFVALLISTLSLFVSVIVALKYNQLESIIKRWRRGIALLIQSHVDHGIPIPWEPEQDPEDLRQQPEHDAEQEAEQPQDGCKHVIHVCRKPYTGAARIYVLRLNGTPQVLYSPAVPATPVKGCNAV